MELRSLYQFKSVCSWRWLSIKQWLSREKLKKGHVTDDKSGFKVTVYSCEMTVKDVIRITFIECLKKTKHYWGLGR